MGRRGRELSYQKPYPQQGKTLPTQWGEISADRRLSQRNELLAPQSLGSIHKSETLKTSDLENQRRQCLKCYRKLTLSS